MPFCASESSAPRSSFERNRPTLSSNSAITATVSISARADRIADSVLRWFHATAAPSIRDDPVKENVLVGGELPRDFRAGKAARHIDLDRTQAVEPVERSIE